VAKDPDSDDGMAFEDEPETQGNEVKYDENGNELFFSCMDGPPL
jgi:hypothetical protein